MKSENIPPLCDVAKIAAKAAKQTVHDAMKARSRPSPWEVTEAWLKIGVMESLSKSGLRVFDELRASEIANICVNDEWIPHHILDETAYLPCKR